MSASGWEDYNDSRRPTLAELAEDAADDERARVATMRAEQAARDRGEYVPSPWMQLMVAALGITLTQANMTTVTVTATREGVVRIDTTRPTTVAAALGKYDTRVAEGVVWVKVERGDDMD